MDTGSAGGLWGGVYPGVRGLGGAPLGHDVRRGEVVLNCFKDSKLLIEGRGSQPRRTLWIENLVQEAGEYNCYQ